MKRVTVTVGPRWEALKRAQEKRWLERRAEARARSRALRNTLVFGTSRFLDLMDHLE